MTKDLITIIEEILPKECEVLTENESEIDFVAGRNSAIKDIQNKIPQLVEEIVDEIKSLNVNKIKVQTKESVNDFTEDFITIPLDQENAVKLSREATINEIIINLTGKNI